jgi:hypothetical protein
LFKRFPAYLIVLFLVSQASGQNGITSHPDWYIKPVISEGFILVHRVSIGHLVKGYPTTYEVNLVKPSLGNKLWQLENNLPEMGISLQCMDFANPQQLGYALTAAPFIEIPLNVEVKASRPVLRVCWGLTYITKRFDVHENHKNTAIGSNFNAFVQFRFGWHLKINDILRFEPSISFSHASNGKARNPNLGLNVVSLGAGLNIRIPGKKPVPSFSVDSSGRAKSKNELVASGSVGFNQRGINTEKLNSYVFSLSYQRNVRNTHKFSLGTDIYLDEIYKQDYNEKYGADPEGLDRYRMSVRAGYSYNVGRISFPIEVGVYVMQKFNPDAAVVSRLGARYYHKSGLVASFGLRTHFAVAYAFEYGLGYRLYLK